MSSQMLVDGACFTSLTPFKQAQFKSLEGRGQSSALSVRSLALSFVWQEQHAWGQSKAGPVT